MYKNTTNSCTKPFAQGNVFSKKQCMTQDELLETGKQWFRQQNWQPFPFQLEAWQAYLEGCHGLVNAPTGSGKTYSLIIPILLEFLRDTNDPTKENNGLRAVWITPIRALTKEIQSAARRAAADLGLHWQIGIRSGDTKTGERTRQKNNPPEILITTPESLHLLLASKGYDKYFKNLQTVVVDEWHELLGSKRGVQMELALSRLKGLLPKLKVWGISATIGNMDEALAVLLGNSLEKGRYKVIRARVPKPKKDRHLQSSSQLFFEVFNDYDPENLLLLQAYDEVMSFQLQEARLREALARIRSQKVVLSRPAKATPFSFPIIVNRLRERLSSEKLEDRIRRMKLQLR